jgi:halocyanin-like protein
MSEPHVSRRTLLRGAGVGGAATVGVAAAGPVAAQPAFGGWMSDVDNYGEVVDATGRNEVTVTVGAEGNGGAFAFEPAAVQIDPGTTIVWEWTGEGGQHNVVAREGADFESELTTEAGFRFSQSPDSEGVITYYCQPHQQLGMKGVVVVGALPEAESGGGENGGSNVPQVPQGAKTLGVATTVAMVTTLGLAYVFMKYGGDYGTPDE